MILMSILIRLVRQSCATKLSCTLLLKGAVALYDEMILCRGALLRTSIRRDPNHLITQNDCPAITSIPPVQPYHGGLAELHGSSGVGWSASSASLDMGRCSITVHSECDSSCYASVDWIHHPVSGLFSLRHRHATKTHRAITQKIINSKILSWLFTSSYSSQTQHIFFRKNKNLLPFSRSPYSQGNVSCCDLHISRHILLTIEHDHNTGSLHICHYREAYRCFLDFYKVCIHKWIPSEFLTDTLYGCYARNQKSNNKKSDDYESDSQHNVCNESLVVRKFFNHSNYICTI